MIFTEIKKLVAEYEAAEHQSKESIVERINMLMIKQGNNILLKQDMIEMLTPEFLEGIDSNSN